MTALLLRALILLVIAAVVWFGVRRIWRDWTAQFRAEDNAVRKRDLEERKRPDVITLERDKDGTFRPPGSDDQG
jgi:hypothetical protein